jgi:hypothetical protein
VSVMSSHPGHGADHLLRPQRRRRGHRWLASAMNLCLNDAPDGLIQTQATPARNQPPRGTSTTWSTWESRRRVRTLSRDLTRVRTRTGRHSPLASAGRVAGWPAPPRVRRGPGMVSMRSPPGALSVCPPGYLAGQPAVRGSAPAVGTELSGIRTTPTWRPSFGVQLTAAVAYGVARSKVHETSPGSTGRQSQRCGTPVPRHSEAGQQPRRLGVLDPLGDQTEPHECASLPCPDDRRISRRTHQVAVDRRSSYNTSTGGYADTTGRGTRYRSRR